MTYFGRFGAPGILEGFLVPQSIYPLLDGFNPNPLILGIWNLLILELLVQKLIHSAKHKHGTSPGVLFRQLSSLNGPFSGSMLVWESVSSPNFGTRIPKHRVLEGFLVPDTHTLTGFWNPNPQILGIWTLWVKLPAAARHTQHNHFARLLKSSPCPRRHELRDVLDVRAALSPFRLQNGMSRRGCMMKIPY